MELARRSRLTRAGGLRRTAGFVDARAQTADCPTGGHRRVRQPRVRRPGPVRGWLRSGAPGGGSFGREYGGEDGRAGGHGQGAAELGRGIGAGPQRIRNLAGHGPKGYRRPDARSQEDVSRLLTWDPRIDRGEIELRVVGLAQPGGARRRARKVGGRQAGAAGAAEGAPRGALPQVIMSAAGTGSTVLSRYGPTPGRRLGGGATHRVRLPRRRGRG